MCLLSPGPAPSLSSAIIKYYFIQDSLRIKMFKLHFHLMMALTLSMLCMILAESQSRVQAQVTERMKKKNKCNCNKKISKCELETFDPPASKSVKDTTGLTFAPPIFSVVNSCPTGSQVVSCNCVINSFKNGQNQVKTKHVGWGTFGSRGCICNWEYNRFVSEEVELSAQARCIRIKCS